MPNLSACTIYFEYLLTILIKDFFLKKSKLSNETMEDGRSMTTFYHCSVNHQSSFSKLSYIFNTSKCAVNYVISFKVYDGFIGQKILKVGKSPIRPWLSCPYNEHRLVCLWTFRPP